MSAKRTLIPEEDATKTLNPTKIAEREYLNKYNRVQ